MLKEIDMAGALARLKDGSDQICAIIPVTKETTLNELMNARGFTLSDGTENSGTMEMGYSVHLKSSHGCRYLNRIRMKEIKNE